MSAQPGVKLLFESRTCTRCGGSGSYSYNPMHGSVCYGCGGRGVQLTRRGRAAQDYFNDLLTRPAGEITIGERVLYPGVPDVPGFGPRWFTVDEITLDPNNQGLTVISGKDAKGDGYSQHVLPETKIQVAHSKVERQALIQQALAYQATLTKLGHPRKQRAPRPEPNLEAGALRPTSVFEGI